jgi:AcrR family transcriptional regulator
MTLNENTTSTQVRVLDAASTLFAEKGFRATTVAEICRLAGANIAAVNYYFTSKENLYREAWRHAHVGMLTVYPPDGSVEPHAPPELRLRGRIRGLIQRAMSDDGREFRIMSHEMTSPTGLLAQVLTDSLAPLRQAMRGILAELLGPEADERTLQWCELSVVGPCLHLVHRRHVRQHDPQGGPAVPVAGDLEELVEQFTLFALAGIQETRRRLKAGPAGLVKQDGETT